MTFPAIRGSVCFDGSCETLAACPTSEPCECEYVDQDYLCFDDAYWRGFDAHTMLHDSNADAYEGVGPEVLAYSEALGKAAMAEWWRVPTPSEWLEGLKGDAPPSAQNADLWSADCGVYTMVLVASPVAVEFHESERVQIFVDAAYEPASLVSTLEDVVGARSLDESRGRTTGAPRDSADGREHEE